MLRRLTEFVSGRTHRTGRALPPAAIFLLLGAVLLSQITSLWLPTRDGAAYLSIAKSIAAGDGALRFGNPHLHFFPGYPALIAPAFFLNDQPIVAIAWIHLLMSALFLAACYAWLYRQMPEHALLLTVFSVLNVSVLYYFRRTLSEAAFMPFLLCSTVFMDRALDEHGSAGRRPIILATLASIYLCTVRLAGVTLAAGFLCMLVRATRAGELSRFRASLYGAMAAALPVATALLLVYYDHATATGDGATYYDELTGSSLAAYEQILMGVQLRIQEIGRILLPGAFKAYGGWQNPIMLLYLPLAVAVVVGWWHALRQRPSALLFACPFYVGLYVVWPHDQGTRFMTPLVPVLWLALATLIRDSRWRTHLPRFTPWLLLACLATSAGYFVSDRVDARKLASYAAMTEGMAAVVPPRAAIGFLRTSKTLSANAFASYCAARFDRRCEEIADPGRDALAPQLDYIAVLGPPVAIAGFAPILRQQELTVLRRAS